MSTAQLIWLIVAIVVVLLIVALVAMMVRRRQAAQRAEQDRARAEQLRQDAVAGSTVVQDSDLEARQARLEAERLRLEAEKAQERAREAEQGVRVEEARQEDKLREADRVDPDVDHRADGYQPTPPGPAAGTHRADPADPAHTTAHDAETGRPAEPRRDDTQR
jgi:FtsZ-interacting cell division protein ZipA